MLSGKTPKIQYLQCGILSGCYPTRANLVWAVVVFKINTFLNSILCKCLKFHFCSLFEDPIDLIRKMLSYYQKKAYHNPENWISVKW